jgi:predicted small integral membrane protein
MLRGIKIALIVLVGAWGLLGGIGNLAGYEGGHAQVVAVMGRDGVTFEAGGPFVAVHHPALTHLGFAVIWLGKLFAGSLCLLGAAAMWRARRADGAAFNAAKTLALSGCGVALAMLLGGFVVAGGVYFGMWSSELGQRSHGFATQFITAIGIAALFVGLPDD